MSNVNRRIVMGIAVLSLCVLLAATAYAFGLFQVELLNNYFHTGTIAVSIVMEEDPDGADLTDTFYYEPGMTVRGNFTVRDYKFDDEGNKIESTDENGIYYRIYFSHLDGELANIMQARIYKPDGTPIYSGLAKDLSSPSNFPAIHIPYQENGNSHSYTLELHYPKLAGNDTQKQTMTFALAVKATQSTANPNKEY